MPPTDQDTFRVLGKAIDHDDPFVDLTVDGVDEEGRIYLTENLGDGEYTFTPEDFRTLFESKQAVGKGNVPTDHALWTNLENVGQNRQSGSGNNFVNHQLREAEEALFQALIEAGQD